MNEPSFGYLDGLNPFIGFLNASEVSVRLTDTAAPDALPDGSRHIMKVRAIKIACAFLFRVTDK
jgi:hypothetical protein